VIAQIRMQLQREHPELQGWQRLVGTWATEATHPGLPVTDDDNAINGQAELSRDDGATWEHDLAITCRRIG
jgi:hypothetical protein